MNWRSRLWLYLYGWRKHPTITRCYERGTAMVAQNSDGSWWWHREVDNEQDTWCSDQDYPTAVQAAKGMKQEGLNA